MIGEGVVSGGIVSAYVIAVCRKDANSVNTRKQRQRADRKLVRLLLRKCINPSRCQKKPARTLSGKHADIRS